jgi:hypothetical protein
VRPRDVPISPDDPVNKIRSAVISLVHPCDAGCVQPGPK